MREGSSELENATLLCFLLITTYLKAMSCWVEVRTDASDIWDPIRYHMMWCDTIWCGAT